jgi:hypothetical protein
VEKKTWAHTGAGKLTTAGKAAWAVGIGIAGLVLVKAFGQNSASSPDRGEHAQSPAPGPGAPGAQGAPGGPGAPSAAGF